MTIHGAISFIRGHEHYKRYCCHESLLITAGDPCWCHIYSAPRSDPCPSSALSRTTGIKWSDFTKQSTAQSYALETPTHSFKFFVSNNTTPSSKVLARKELCRAHEPIGVFSGSTTCVGTRRVQQCAINRYPYFANSSRTFHIIDVVRVGANALTPPALHTYISPSVNKPSPLSGRGAPLPVVLLPTFSIYNTSWYRYSVHRAARLDLLAGLLVARAAEVQSRRHSRSVAGPDGMRRRGTARSNSPQDSRQVRYMVYTVVVDSMIPTREVRSRSSTYIN